MRKLFAACATAALAFTVSISAQDLARNNNNNDAAPNRGHAPKQVNGIGRLDLRVTDTDGNPIQNAYAQLESRRTDGFFCEAYGSTDARGVFAMPPLHMGDLTLKVKAKGYESASVAVDRNALGEPVTVRLVKKN